MTERPSKGRDDVPQDIRWEKCLAPASPLVRGYDQVVWMDADILINPEAPDVAAEVPLEKIGGVDEYATPSPEERRVANRLMEAHWRSRGHQVQTCQGARHYYRYCDLPGDYDQVLQGGVMVYSPDRHTDLFLEVYDIYARVSDDYPNRNGEMPVFSYECLLRDLVHWLDYRYNMLWIYALQLERPHLFEKPAGWRRRLQKWRLYCPEREKRRFLRRTLERNHFLHFAAAVHDMEYADPRFRLRG
ncbi:MAG: hypothetical protein AAGK14_12690 [Verrucomicrobiota bacterium]